MKTLEIMVELSIMLRHGKYISKAVSEPVVQEWKRKCIEISQYQHTVA